MAMEMGTGSGEIKQMRAPVEQDFMVKGKQVVLEKHNHEWDLNEWKWDGNLFVAERWNSGQSFSNDEELLPIDAVVENEKAVEKRRKLLVLKEHEFEQGEASLTLKLGGDIKPFGEREDGNCEENRGKRFKSQPSLLNPPLCQVDACNANLNDVRDYHRRHKVCETHAKATRVLLGGVLQRFCQQCSRFHLLQEFDEEKKSCRKRLAGHNRRRRKNTLDTIVSGNLLKDDHASRYILICLLKILTNLHSKDSDQSKDQDRLFQLLGMLSSPTGISEPAILSGLASLLSETFTGDCVQLAPAILSSSLRSVTVPETSAVMCSTVAASSSISNRDPITSVCTYMPMNVARECHAQVSLPTHNSPNGTIGSVPLHDTNAMCPILDGSQRKQSNTCSLMLSVETKVGDQAKPKINDFDLNSSYNELQDCKEGSERLSQNDSKISHIGHSDFPSWTNQDVPETSPAQSNGNSESPSDNKSLSSLGEDVQCYTDRIIFKLFGKDPGDLPHVLRAQILNWLSHSPTDIESYIKPGCIVLTIYLRLSKHLWKELCGNLASSLKRLLEVSDDIFWRTGWICAKVGHQMAFIYNGQVLLDMPLSRSQDTPFIVSVSPVAVGLSEEAIFTVKGRNLARTTAKLLCAFHGRQIVHEIGLDPKELNGSSSDSFENLDGYNEETQTLSFACSFSKTIGRGFIEVEDHGLGSGFFPFIVAEHEICSEIRTLENSIETIELTSNEMSSRNQIIEFLLEFGWLLERSHLMISRPELTTLQSAEFSCVRFKRLLEFSIERDWCAVVKKILDILFNRRVGGPDYSVDQLLNGVSPLHRAVRRNCRPMVDFLLKYTTEDKRAPKASQEMKYNKNIFKSTMRGPAGITPLHIAASIEGADDVLNLLTDDPEQEWVQTWEKGWDESGFTPQDYAQQRGHYHYIDLVQRKKYNKAAVGHLILDISNPLPATRKVEESPSMPQGSSYQYKQNHSAFNVDCRNTEKLKCRACERMSVYRSGHRLLNYRPAILSMVAVAAVCVCLSLLLKSPPEVLFVVAFRWEHLAYGYI